MGKGDQSAQLLKCYRFIESLIQKGALDRHQIAEILGVEASTADRHIKAAQKEIGALKERKHRGRKIVFLDLENASPPPSRQVAIAAALGASIARLFRSSTYELLLAEALGHVLRRVRQDAEFREAKRKFVFVPGGGEFALLDRQDLLDDLVDAVLTQRWVRIAYTHFNGEQENIEMQPWSIVIYDHQLYVAGSNDAKPLWPYRLARVGAVEILNRTFRYPDRATYDPDTLLAQVLGIFVGGSSVPEDVVIRLHSRWATYVRTHRWHATQQQEFHADHVIVRLHLRVCPEVERLILGFGPEAEVLAPALLRQRISERVQEMARVYAGPRVAAADS